MNQESPAFNIRRLTAERDAARAQLDDIHAYLKEKRDYWQQFIQERDFLGPDSYPVGIAEGMGLAVQRLNEILDGPQP